MMTHAAAGVITRPFPAAQRGCFRGTGKDWNSTPVHCWKTFFFFLMVFVHFLLFLEAILQNISTLRCLQTWWKSPALGSEPNRGLTGTANLRGDGLSQQPESQRAVGSRERRKKQHKSEQRRHTDSVKRKGKHTSVVMPLRQAVKGHLSLYVLLLGPWGLLSQFWAPQDNGKWGGCYISEVNEDRDGLRLHPVTDPNNLSGCVHVWERVQLEDFEPAATSSDCWRLFLLQHPACLVTPADKLESSGQPVWPLAAGFIHSPRHLHKKTLNEGTSSTTDIAVWRHAGAQL